ncbi:MAG: ABC transporter permease [Armatimonadota bacterium]|nr:ABC transporter permease [Armatimonadota bacterium]MDR7485720.1 ABC transporter permease [Armatimonadota bacterium]MDR7534163.1 ABC transporter permease [Armatimonadota bacterium]MDR7536384.1 ABC transporter permease [Armatimonadota bacterium]
MTVRSLSGLATAGRPAPLADVTAYVVAVVVAAVVGALVIALLGGDVGAAFATLARASVGSAGGVAQTLNKATPLMLGSLAVVVGMRGGYVNIGVDGQIYAGAIAATGLAFALAGIGLPGAVLVVAVLLAGVAGGALWVLTPALLRARAGVSEVFVTVMLNFVALFLTEYLATGPWNDPVAGEAISRPIPSAAALPMVLRGGAHAGIVLVLAAGVAVAWMLARTLLGYQIRAVGDNPRAARLGGIALGRITVITLLLSGALAGLAGAIEVTGFHQRLILGLSPGYGIMAILIAVIARRHPMGAMVAALLMAALLVGSDSLQRSIGLPASAVFVFQAVILLVLLLVEGLREVVRRAPRPETVVMGS